jgi:hypothetical protein
MVFWHDVKELIIFEKESIEVKGRMEVKETYR